MSHAQDWRAQAGHSRQCFNNPWASGSVEAARITFPPRAHRARRCHAPKNVSFALSRPREISIWIPCTNNCILVPYICLVQSPQPQSIPWLLARPGPSRPVSVNATLNIILVLLQSFVFLHAALKRLVSGTAFHNSRSSFHAPVRSDHDTASSNSAFVTRTRLQHVRQL